MCTLSTYDSEGDEIVVHVTMKPHDATSQTCGYAVSNSVPPPVMPWPKTNMGQPPGGGDSTPAGYQA